MLPCGYVPGLESDSPRRIPGLKIETWGTRPVPYTFVTMTEFHPPVPPEVVQPRRPVPFW